MRKLKLFVAAAALMGALTANAYQTPTADGIYYLYNTACTDGTPGFMSTGNNYGFQVVIDNFGFPVKLISTGTENTYQFQFIHHNGYLSDDGFMYSDGGTDRARTITVQDQGNGNYKLLNTNNSKEIEDWYGNVVGDGEGNRHNYIWQFLSKDERNAMIAGYTKDQKMAAATSMGISLDEQTSAAFDSYISANYIGIDQSSLIKNGTFDTSHNTEGWTTSANDNRNFNIGWGNAEPKTTPEVYEGAGAITQTVTVEKEGLYKVSVNATYRCGNNDNNNRIGDMGYDASVAYLKANNNFTKIDDWYSGKINGNGPGSPSEANSTYFSAGKYYTEVYVYVGEEKTIEISLHSHAFTWGGWLMFNNFKLTYYSNEVSAEDASAIAAEAQECESKPMLAATKTVLQEALAEFDAVKTIANYNTLRAAIDAANLSAEKYAPLGTKLEEAAAVKTAVSDNSPSYVSTFDANIAAIKKDYEEGNIAEDAISAKVADAEAEIVALVKSQTANGSDMTRALPNAAGNAAVGNDNWKIESALAEGEAFHLDTWAGTASGMAVPMIEYWIINGKTLSSNTIYQTLTGLQKGVYTITATTAVNNEANVAPNAGSALLFANEETTDLTSGATETSFKGQTGDFSVSVLVGDDGELKLGFKTVDPNYNWLAFKNVKIVFEGESATAADVETLNAAIAAAEDHTLGFEADEYAPYNNVAALEALAAAKAINPNAASSTAVVAATNALTAATWTANTADVECVYNGNFAIGQGSSYTDIQKYGWNRTNGWGQFQNGAEGDDTNGTVYYNQPGSMEYGNAGVYTMPLKANTIYTLTFKYASWATDSNDGMTASVLNGEQGMAAIAYEANDTEYKAANSLVTKTIKFVTGEAGNYVLKLANSGNTVITGVSITKDASQVLEFADGAVPTYAPGTYPAVKITRSLAAGKWATAIYPFAVSGLDKMATLDSYEGTTLNFTSITESKPNEPFLMRSESDKSEIELNNVAVVATEANEVVKGNASLKGVYAETTVSAAEGVTNYVLSSNVIYPVGANAATVDPYRAYIQVSESAARSLKFVVDGGESTGIEGVAAADAENARVYNLNGQQVKSAQKGIFIQNGKKVVMK